MRIMAFDYGTKRIGVAVTDPLQIIANALTTVHPDEVWNFLAKYLEQEPVAKFIVGLPLQMDGTPSQSSSHVVGFVRKLKKTYPQIPVETMDERFTSKMATASILASGANRKQRRDKSLVDAVSATLILQSYMEKVALQGGLDSGTPL
ncbi:MAG TPA: Holliday junction resolvase RuvX [Sphingobacteriaceae bacterium]|nr:Holliday junction resolvase RuvX [Sphingobacteriaceae bacterium]